MYVAIKGFVLIAWLTAGGQSMPQATFATLEDCNAASTAYPKEFQTRCLPNVVLQLALTGKGQEQVAKQPAPTTPDKKAK